MALVLLLLVFGASFTAASSIGTFSSDSDRQIDSRSTEFTISVFNLGDDPVELDIRSTDLNDAIILHPDSMTVAPSKVTRNPDSDLSWFLLDDGRYVQTVEIPIEIIIDEARNTNNFNFDVDLQATSDISTNTEGAVQNLAQVRSYSFSVKTTSPSLSEPEPPRDTGLTGRLAESANKGFEQLSEGLAGLSGRSQGSERSSQNEIERSDNLEDTTTDDLSSDEPDEIIDQKSSSTDSDNNQEKPRNTKSPTGNFVQSSGVNGVTVFLLLMMSVSAIYLFRVI